MKKLITLAFFVIGTMPVMAQTKMILHQKNGADISVLLSEKPVAKYEGSEFVITTKSNDATLRFMLSALDRITYEDITTAVKDFCVVSKDSGPSQVFDLNGRLIMTISEGEAVEAAALAKGIYVIKNKNYSYKIQKR